MNENIEQNESMDENTNDNTKDSKSNGNLIPTRNSFRIQNNKNQNELNENDQTQFSMEIIQTTSPSELTPSTVQSHNPDEKKELQKYHFCDGCCTDTPIRTSSSRIGPFSSYSVCFFFFLNIIFPHFEIFLYLSD